MVSSSPVPQLALLSPQNTLTEQSKGTPPPRPTAESEKEAEEKKRQRAHDGRGRLVRLEGGLGGGLRRRIGRRPGRRARHLVPLRARDPAGAVAACADADR